ncbi:S-methyl-5-thioribose-1-phosphate isomerase [Dactylosporangium siamense]|uniref:Methylthioribose-1-phosphate isomerase n=1 Tax=Dactylosporangium siamense TaxID=685454 RepID=A0A919UD43_9ACTN|nr:S-methyl-5-thioribose-1-phosphate isomerase [Dactylosporangium siamense]GIG47486.1 methylthioribose-1-phosphate isomerase [Dactylosporangium siamense]
MRTIDWVDGAVVIVDQTRLPHEVVWLRLSTVDALIDAIQRLAVRGAPALGVAGAMGVALAARSSADPSVVAGLVHRIETARPTAVNLARGAGRAAAVLPSAAAALEVALRIRDEEIHSSTEMARLGADLVTSLCGASVRLLTHCNTGALATVVGGTALAVAFELHRRGTLGGVIASETRPLLQGARLTTWELARAGVPHRLAVDSAGPFLMARGEVDAVILGADRICANGDVVNKVGSYAHALGARAAGIPFICVAPESTVDLSTPSGAEVEIEDRGAAEIVGSTAPPGTAAVNPAFDVTPASLVTAIVTDTRVWHP